MNSKTAARIRWQCPRCGQVFYVPRQPAPDTLCPSCRAASEPAASTSGPTSLRWHAQWVRWIFVLSSVVAVLSWVSLLLDFQGDREVNHVQFLAVPTIVSTIVAIFSSYFGVKWIEGRTGRYSKPFMAFSVLMAASAAVSWTLLLLDVQGRHELAESQTGEIMFLAVLSSLLASVSGAYGYEMVPRDQHCVKRASGISALAGATGTLMCCVCPCYDCCTSPGPCVTSIGLITLSSHTTKPTWWSRWSNAFSHHPSGPKFDADVYKIANLRLCVGCFTAYPSFLLALMVLPLAPVTWQTWMILGPLAASAQILSSLGLAHHRWMKATIKCLLGGGLGAIAVGTVASPWPLASKWGFLFLVVCGAFASTIPRMRRLQAYALMGLDGRHTVSNLPWTEGAVVQRDEAEGDPASHGVHRGS